MSNGDIDRNTIRRRLLVGAFALTVAGSLAACTTEKLDSGGAAVPAASPSAAAVNYFGPDGYGKLTIGMTEKQALATGDLRSAPVSTVLGKNVYSFVDGPKPDPKRMAADEKIEKAVEKAQANTSTSARTAPRPRRRTPTRRSASWIVWWPT
jgi:hypothetical protein